MRQILGEVYPDVVEQYHDKVITTAGGETFPQLDELYHSKYKKYLRSVIRQIRESNDDSSWLSCVPYKDEKGKIKDYVYVQHKDEHSRRRGITKRSKRILVKTYTSHL